MPRHSVRNSISRPFLPLKHALVKPKTERGISSDSPSIQLARALLESALRDADSSYSTCDSTISASTSIATSYEAEEDIPRDSSTLHSNSTHNASVNANAKALKEKDSKTNAMIGKRHSRKTKSLDLSMIGRPIRLQCASPSPTPSTSKSSSSISITSIHTDHDPSCISKSKSTASHEKGTDQGIINVQVKGESQDALRPRSKSVSVISQATTPSILLTTITESSEEHSTTLLVTPSPNEKIEDASRLQSSKETSYMSDTENNKSKRYSHTIGRSRASSLAIIPENERERTLRAKSEGKGSYGLAISNLLSVQSGKIRKDDDKNKEKNKEDQEKEEDWEVLSLRKRRKSVKYQSTSTSTFIATLPGAPPTASTCFTAPSPANATPSSSVSTCQFEDSQVQQNMASSTQLRRRTSSFKSIKNQFLNRPLPRYRRASANDAITSRNNLTTTVNTNLYPSEQIVHKLGEVIRSSPSTNLDVWSGHLQALLEETRIEGQESDSRVLVATAGDDSGFAPSLHEDSSIYSPERNNLISQAQSRTIKKGGLPRIPTLALISPMGTLRRHISCPDGILSTTSPTKKQHRPLPALPEDHLSMILVGEGSFSPVLPPLPPHHYDSDTETHDENVKETSLKKKSVRRMSVVSNLRRQIQEQEEEYAGASMSSNHTQACRSSTYETLQSSNIDSFKTARSNQSSNLWPPPEELFASLFNTLPSPNLPATSPSAGTDTTRYKKVAFSPSTKASVVFESFEASSQFATNSMTSSYVYDPSTPNARKALQLVPRDLNTDLEVKPWWVVLPRSVLDDLAVGVRNWDKDRLEVYNLTRSKSRQKSI